MGDRKELLDNVATIIGDYRKGEITAPNAPHVDTWVKQFPQAVQEPILAELAHVFSRTYFNKKSVQEFLAGVISSDKLRLR